MRAIVAVYFVQRVNNFVVIKIETNAHGAIECNATRKEIKIQHQIPNAMFPLFQSLILFCSSVRFFCSFHSLPLSLSRSHHAGSSYIFRIADSIITFDLHIHVKHFTCVSLSQIVVYLFFLMFILFHCRCRRCCLFRSVHGCFFRILFTCLNLTLYFFNEIHWFINQQVNKHRLKIGSARKKYLGEGILWGEVKSAWSLSRFIYTMKLT